ncbi:MAG: GGDEF domain-containing protein [Deltaproteobacteria bacterium]|jgi:two-component system cell cycle response regulator|nr:GGDEF domain-containing protein [Deltaproteobacteria bacterium]
MNENNNGNGSGNKRGAMKRTHYILQPDARDKEKQHLENEEEEVQTKVTKLEQPQKKVKRNGVLIIMYPPEAGLGRTKEIPESSKIIIGRQPGVEVQLINDSVSRQHAQIISNNGKYMIRDMGSTNGTYVNDTMIRGRRFIKNQDMIRVGTVLLKFLHGDQYETIYHDEVYRLTIIDALTDAYNKRYLIDYLDREIERTKRSDYPLSLVMIDIDHFKEFNDNYGHLIGDLVLKEVARRIKSTVRKNEIFARYGGEEFTVALPDTGLKGAMEFAERARKAVGDNKMNTEGSMVTVTISLGVYTFDPNHENINSPEELIQKADTNLYKAKNAGRNCVVYE